MKRAAVWMVLALLVAGCQPGSRPGETPEATFAVFNQAMVAGAFDAAAGLIDLEAQAKVANPDWDSIPAGQQQQILTKMRADAASRLQGLNYPPAGLEVSGSVVNGDRAQLAAGRDSFTLKLELVRGADGWKVFSGLPTMTSE